MYSEPESIDCQHGSASRTHQDGERERSRPSELASRRRCCTAHQRHLQHSLPSITMKREGAQADAVAGCSAVWRHPDATISSSSEESKLSARSNASLEGRRKKKKISDSNLVAARNKVSKLFCLQS
ncbi:hypothetical protein PHSY_006119 [Pseudozyma hubeiensis SY62]|uniref:Uncharacterized protein n=1 Tax=Pseudozyma hubeiensis (strain SY62) TaxID=1305764 RepID=R9PK82_PSEHS|nr:hypothetical protein PHSY_006119 [Pseudozyma hubeiensis SY62]GAC98525.1 hypothetical protein PHSY_006119 [Pseudozyma hubeiensis SY62]